MKLYKFAFFYRTFRKKSIRFLRISFFLLTFLYLLISFYEHFFPRIPLIFLSLFSMSEIYYEFFIKKAMPVRTILQKKEKDEIIDFFTIRALSCYFFDSSIKDMVNELVKFRACLFLLGKANINSKEIEYVNIDKKQIANKAFEISKTVFGKYVTTVDLLVAYLILLNEKNSFFVKKHLKENDLLNILYWTRFNYPNEENPSDKRIKFLGEGIFDNITFGWTPFTKNFIRDLTSKVIFNKPAVVGRRREFKQITDILSKSEKNNALLVGDVGAGKNSLVEAFAYDSFIGIMSDKINHKRVYELAVGPLLAGTTGVADLEMRLEILMEEINHSGNIIIYLPDLENILGSETYKTDLSDALIPYFKNPHLPIIATVSTSSFKNYVENKQNFINFFEIIKFEEPNRNDAIQMVLEKTSKIEKEDKVIFTFKSIVTAVDLSKRFMLSKVLPGSAINLLKSVATSASLEHKRIIDENDIEEKIESVTRVSITTPKKEEKDLLLNLENILNKKIIGQEKAIKSISQALRRLRTGMVSNNRPISFLFLGPTGVGKTETAKVLADVYFNNKRNFIRLDMSEYKNSDAVNRLLGSAPGEGNEKGELTEKVLENPFSLILLDEFEKANPQILDLFLQILDDGRLTDNKGKTVSFSNTIIIATSNAGSLFIKEKIKENALIDTNFKKDLISEIEKNNLFKIELLNRFDEIIIFSPLTLSNIEKIALILLDEFKEKLKERDIELLFDQKTIVYLANKGFDSEFGARPLRRAIEEDLEDVIAKGVLEEKIKSGTQIKITANPEKGLQFQD